jgi:hypothetical protein
VSEVPGQAVPRDTKELLNAAERRRRGSYGWGRRGRRGGLECGKIGVVGERPWQELVNEELFEWEALNGIRALVHLLTYRGAVAVPVCVVGSFDGDLLGLPSSMPEILATALGDRLGRDDFRLVLWSPRDGRYPFCELDLSRVAPREFQQDSLAVLDPVSGEEVTRQRRSRTVRFANPRWLRRTEDEMAQLLGEAAIRELRSYAGQPGDYTPERLFGSVGHRQAEQVRLHNRQIASQLDAQIEEWSPGPPAPPPDSPRDREPAADMSDHDELSDESDEPHDPEERRWRRWRPPQGTPEDRWKLDAYERMMDLDRMLYHLYSTRGVSDPNLYPIDPESLKPDWPGPPDDGFPFVGEDDGRLVIAEIGRLIAAMGGYLELLAVFPDVTITLAVEPGPEHLHDHD